MRGHDFTRAIEHQRRQIARFWQVHDRGQLHSATLALEALLLIRQHGMESVVIQRAEERERFGIPQPGPQQSEPQSEPQPAPPCDSLYNAS